MIVTAKSSETQSTSPMATKEMLHQAALKIFGLGRRTALALAVDTGEIIIVDLCGGKVEQFYKRNYGEATLEGLVEELNGLESEQDWTRTRLQRSVGVYCQGLAFGGFDAWPDLELGHMYEVMALKYEDQRKLLDDAQAKQMTCAELRDAVREFKAAKNGPQPPDTPYPDRYRDTWAAIYRLGHALEMQKPRIDAVKPNAPLTPASIEEFTKAFDALMEVIGVWKKQLVDWGYKPPKGQWNPPSGQESAAAAPDRQQQPEPPPHAVADPSASTATPIATEQHAAPAPKAAAARPATPPPGRAKRARVAKKAKPARAAKPRRAVAKPAAQRRPPKKSGKARR